MGKYRLTNITATHQTSGTHLTPCIIYLYLYVSFLSKQSAQHRKFFQNVLIINFYDFIPSYFLAYNLHYYGKHEECNWNRHMKKCSTSLTIREIQVKTTVKSEWPASKSLKIANSVEGVGKKRNLLHCW